MTRPKAEVFSPKRRRLRRARARTLGLNLHYRKENRNALEGVQGSSSLHFLSLTTSRPLAEA